MSGVGTAVVNPVDAVASSEMTFEVAFDLEDVSRLRDDWLRLAQALDSSGFFHSPDWHESYLRSFGMGAGDSCVVRAIRDGQTRAVMPLCASRRTLAGVAVRSLELPHNTHMLLCDAPIARGESRPEVLRELMRFLRRASPFRWDVLLLPNLPDGACLHDAIVSGVEMSVVREQGRCDILPCGGYAEMLKGFSKNFRGNLRKARNKLNAATEVHFESTRDPRALRDALTAFLDLEASGWKGDRGTRSAVKFDCTTSRFYEALCETFSRSGACEINLLRVGGRPVAAQFCLLAGRVSYMLKIAYDESFAPLAPGNMLLEHTMQRYERSGEVHAVNLVTDADWHASWKPRSIGVSSAWVFNRTPRGLLAWAAFRARLAAGRAYRERLLPLIQSMRRSPRGAEESAVRFGSKRVPDGNEHDSTDD